MYADVIIILGKHLQNGQPDADALARAQAGADCWIAGRSPAIITCGGQRDDEPCAEADWLAEELIRRGVPPHVIHPERESLNTLQNITNAKRVMDGLGLTTALIITSATHLPRAMAVCRSVGLSAKSWPVISNSPNRVKGRLVELLGFIEWKLGLQRPGQKNPLSRFIRNITGS